MYTWHTPRGNAFLFNVTTILFTSYDEDEVFSKPSSFSYLGGILVNKTTMSMIKDGATNHMG